MDLPRKNNLNAILLAAGSGYRLKGKTEGKPKCLIEVDGESLLVRHLKALDSCGISRLHIVTGYQSQQIEAHLSHYTGPLSIHFVENRDYLKGSILSLKRGLMSLSVEPDLLIMDADVLYPDSLLRRLVEGDFSCGLLLDPRASAQGEEMMLGVRNGLVHSISRELVGQWDLVGEGVGFFIIDRLHVSALKRSIERTLATLGPDADYEMAIDHFLSHHPAGYLSVEDLPWTEIDFEKDLAFAEEIILPKILALNTKSPNSAEPHEKPLQP